MSNHLLPDDIFEFGVSVATPVSRRPKITTSRQAAFKAERSGFGFFLTMGCIAILCISGFGIGSLAQATVMISVGDKQIEAPITKAVRNYSL